MTLCKPAGAIVHYSQDNNWLHAQRACFPTSVAMAIRNNRIELNECGGDLLSRQCIDDILMTLANTEGVGRKVAREHPDIPDNATFLNEWWSVMEQVTQYFVNGWQWDGNAKRFVMWSEMATDEQIKQEIDKGYMVVIGTRLTHGGHVVCVSGYTADSYILNDPFGNPNKGYRTDVEGGKNGNQVVLEPSLLHKLRINGGNTRFRALFIHADKKNPLR